MNFSFGLSISGLVYIILVAIVFFKRKKFKSLETHIYGYLIIMTTLELICGISGVFTIKYMVNNPTLNKIVNLLYLIFLDGWILLFCFYVISLSENIKNKPKIKKYFKLIYLLVTIIIFCLPINFINKNNIIYSYGKGVNFAYALAILCIIIILYCSVKNINKLWNKKYIPMFLFLFLGTVALVLQIINPKLFLVSPLEVLVTITMFFTIENPDVNLVNEINKNKNLLQHSNEEKSNLLFKLTQDVKLPIENICKTSKDMLNMKKVIDLKNNSKLINDNANRVRFIINNVLDINDIDYNKIKVFNDTYDINNLYKELILMIKNKINNEVKLNTKIDKDIPILYGDNIKLKQILYSILSNSIKYTEKGNIEFNINHFIQYDVCRLIININDTGCGIDIDKINNVLEDNEYIIDDKKIELDLNSVKRLINILGGSIFIDSNKLGTKVSIVLDQRIYETEEIKHNKELNNYIKYIGTEKNVLLIDDNYEELNKYAKELKKYNINVDKSMYGKDILNKIRNNIKYDLIIIDDEMTPYNAVTIMEELNKEENFKTKVIIMLGINKEFIKEHYIKDYKFKDYIIKRNYKTEIERIINKYL